MKHLKDIKNILPAIVFVTMCVQSTGWVLGFFFGVAYLTLAAYEFTILLIGLGILIFKIGFERLSTLMNSANNILDDFLKAVFVNKYPNGASAHSTSKMNSKELERWEALTLEDRVHCATMFNLLAKYRRHNTDLSRRDFDELYLLPHEQRALALAMGITDFGKNIDE